LGTWDTPKTKRDTKPKVGLKTKRDSKPTVGKRRGRGGYLQAPITNQILITN